MRLPRIPIGDVLVRVLPSIVNRILGGKKDDGRGTQPNKPGVQTSEFRSTRTVQIVAAIVAVLAVFYPDMPSESLRETLLWLAGIVAGLAQVSYNSSRAKVKTGLATAAAVQYAATVAQQMQAQGANARDTLNVARGIMASSGHAPPPSPTRQQQRREERERKG